MRVARSEQLQLLLYACALALKRLLHRVAHGGRVERADERGAALDRVGLRLVVDLCEALERTVEALVRQTRKQEPT